MRFLLYNVRYGAGTGPHFHLPVPGAGYLRRSLRKLDRIADFIAAENPDIAGLIEVDAGSMCSGGRNQAEYIGRRLGHYHVFESKYGRRHLARALPVVRKNGNALLSRDTIHGERFHYFEYGMKKLVIELELENLVVFLVHLALGFRARQSQLSDLYTMVKNTGKPHIVAGDFNVFWGDREIRLFLAATGLRSACTNGWASYPSWAPRRQLDFILCSPGIRVTDFRVPRVPYSDHLPLVCDFTAPETGSR